MEWGRTIAGRTTTIEISACNVPVLFLKYNMQTSFPFGAATDVPRIRDALAARYGRLHLTERLEPLCQLVRSVLGCRTRDGVSWPAYQRLVEAYPRWSDLARAPPEDIEAVIGDVTHAGDKARRLGQALRAILARHAEFDLGFLADWPLNAAFTWLERLPGVGPKVAAATLNFSTLDRHAFVADTHVLRVLRRFGIIGEKADAWRAHEEVMAATDGWSAIELIELHALLKHHGQTLCRHNAPRCRDCPLLAHDCWEPARIARRRRGR